MNGCKYIKKRIDEAEKPDVLPFDVSEHIAQCGECERFAHERTALRELVAGGSGSRVNAPINFDAVLKARLAEVSTRRSHWWWLGSPGMLRLGAASAGVVIMIFAAQYAGLFSNEVAIPSNGTQASGGQRSAPPIPPQLTPLEIGPGITPGVIAAGVRSSQGYRSSSRLRRGDVAVDRSMPAGYMTAEDGGVVLVRGRNGDIDVQMPTISVGAQPLLYVSAGQRTTRSVGTSF